ncbi:MAG: hypothetical protein LBV01_05275 [Deltaproteobacteria bacterium]|jgi:hypothetical protein|nr:hypothetical protein [Deltaproteobacteria bacterium]
MAKKINPLSQEASLLFFAAGLPPTARTRKTPRQLFSKGPLILAGQGPDLFFSSLAEKVSLFPCQGLAFFPRFMHMLY